MQNRRTSSLSVFFLFSAIALAGCANDVVEGAAPAVVNEGTKPDGLVIGPTPIVVSFDPVVICSSTVADSSKPFPASPGYRVIGTSDSSKSCDWYTVETTGMLGKTLKLEVDQPLPTPNFVTTKEKCTESSMSAETFGYRPPHWVKNAQGLYYPVEGAWEKISSFTEYGVPFTDGTDCVFPNFEQGWPAGMPGSYEIPNSPYTTVRVVSKAVFYTPTGVVRQPMSTYVIPG
jgi:hypothetical protein